MGWVAVTVTVVATGLLTTITPAAGRGVDVLVVGVPAVLVEA